MKSGPISIVRTIRPLNRDISWGRRALLGGVAVLLVFAPLAYGAVHTWAYYPLALAAAFLSLSLLIHGLIILWITPALWLAWPRPPLWWAVLGFLGLIFFQVVPFPWGLVKALSPMAVNLRALGIGCGLAASVPLSLNPYATLLETLKLWPAMLLFYLLIYAVNTRRQIKILVRVILGVGLLEAFYGFWQFYAHRIWGWKNPYTGMRLCGTFINSDHLAVFLTLATLLGFGLFLAERQREPRLPEHLSGWARLRRWSRAEYLEPRLRRGAWLFLVFLLAVAVIFTGSRGGMISLATGFAAMGLLARSRRSEKGHLYLIGLFLAAAVLYSLWLGSAPLLGRFLQLSDKGRALGFHSALSLWQEFPFLGAGLGTFGELSCRFEPAEFEGLRFVYAHSDWLQLLAETGIAGFVLLAGAWVLFFGGLVKKWRNRKDHMVRGLGLGGLAALVAGAFSALGEFPFHIPGFTLTYAAVAALTYLIVHHHKLPEYFCYPSMAPARHNRMATWIFLGLIGLQFVFMVKAWDWWRAEWAAPSEMDSTRIVQELSAQDFHRALALNPQNSRYYAGLAEILEQGRSAKPQGPGEVAGLLRQAVYRAPANWTYHWQMGEFYLKHCQGSPARFLPDALKEFAAAVTLFPESGFLHHRLAASLDWAGKYYGGLVPVELRDRAAEKPKPRLK